MDPVEIVMKKAGVFIVAAFLVCLSATSFACVGKTLIIGTLKTPIESLEAQLMAVIINERTGTTVNVEYFDTEEQLLAAVKKREVNIYTDNTGRALQQLGMTLDGDAETIYTEVKEAFRKQFHLVMLNPFGKTSDDDANNAYIDVPVVAEGILIDFPALPRVINKLASIAEDKNYPKLIASVESGDKPNQVARDFLKKKRFI